MILISQIFKTFIKPHSIYPNISFYFPTYMKEADALLLSGLNYMYSNIPIEDIYRSTIIRVFLLFKNRVIQWLKELIFIFYLMAMEIKGLKGSMTTPLLEN